MTSRQITAHNILKNHSEQEYHLLGEGMTSVVFHNNQLVYKVFLLDNIEGLSYKRHMLNAFKSKLHLFDNSSFFYPILNFIELDENTLILVYPYEKSEPCKAFEYDEIQDFLVECWQRRLIFQDIKPDNFIRVNGHLKWIDYEPDKFTDNLFLNMATRAFIYCKYNTVSSIFINKLCRSAINNFDLIELNGLQTFINKLFSKIVFKESNEVLKSNRVLLKDVPHFNNLNNALQQLDFDKNIRFSIPYSNDLDIDSLFYNLVNQNFHLDHIDFENINLCSKNYFKPEKIVLTISKLIQPKHKVSLIIKACVQDSEIIYQAVKHITKQIASPNIFDEKIITLDNRESNFLREYNNHNTWNDLITEVTKLKKQGIIDDYIIPNNESTTETNEKYFDLKSYASHTYKGVPVTSQLYAFEIAKNDYILQLDCDAIIGRLDKKHSFLEDMISEIETNENVVSVGFNIYKGKSTGFTPYFGFENGGFVPEVRFCLLNRERLHKTLPLPNEIFQNNLKFSWYRSLELKQKETNVCSIRGGSSKSFFIHPPNFKKKDKDVWFTKIDRTEQLEIPKTQINQFDLIDSYYDWTSPKRNEKLVIVSSFRDISLSRFLRYWYSLVSQSYQDWGLILIDDQSENGISYFIKELIKPYKNRITFINNKFQMGVAHNTYKAIHYFMSNQDSIVTIIDADDSLIGKNALKNLYEKYNYNNADVVVGKMYRTDKLHAHYKYTPNFTNPRLYGGNVWQHIRSFKKYLYDSLGFEDLKIKNQKHQLDDILLSKRFSQKMVFPEHCTDYTYMVPIVEMSSNPIWINHFNILHDRTTINTPKVKKRKNEIINEVLSKKAKSPQDVFFGRKTFLPNLKKIEIDITYECNLKCINCNRSSTQAPIKEGMSLIQIQEFIQESTTLNKKWELINLLGGEPTIHRDFIEIVNSILNNYIIPYSPETILQVTSNGFGDIVQAKLKQLPQHKNLIIDYASFKDERVVPYFSPFNDAPIDNKSLSYQEYSKGCWVTSYCGIGLNQLGYYPCGVAGGIDRVFEKNLGVKKLVEVDESIYKLLNDFCKYCGNFTDYGVNQGNFIPRHEKASVSKPEISTTWKNQYKKYNAKK
ncbi:glycosyltransferase [Winogradskyella rapida]|uniref:Glycosyltransferase n=1 Tax=Winogradskyella rapida TaxID=549701 RepID=A0ABW3KVG6_9FLAO